MADPIGKSNIRVAATVVILKNGLNGLEVLLLKRNTSLKVLGGFWVFPGGVMDNGDIGQTLSSRLLQTAVRETAEETGLDLDHTKLYEFSRWITPDLMPKRFDTFFYLTAEESERIPAIDNQEIIDYQWLSAEKALMLHQSGDLLMMPPTVVTLHRLMPFTSAEEALDSIPYEEKIVFSPKVAHKNDETIMLYPGDDGYLEGNALLEGKQHRCIWANNHWHYISL